MVWNITRTCNLRCVHCYADSHAERYPGELSWEQCCAVIDDLADYKVNALLLSGGEPLLQKDAFDFLAEVREMGFAVKLDTNGCYPQVLSRILEQKLVDYVAMDIKNCKEKYGLTAGIPNFDITPVEESVQLLMAGSVDYEFRTTVVKEFHTVDDIRAIGGFSIFAEVFRTSKAVPCWH